MTEIVGSVQVNNLSFDGVKSHGYYIMDFF